MNFASDGVRTPRDMPWAFHALEAEKDALFP